MTPPRGRNPDNKGLAKYVYWNNGTLIYRRRGYPSQQLGSDVAAANEMAEQITAMIDGTLPLPDPLAAFRERQVRPTLPGGSPLVSDVLDRFVAHWKEETKPSRATIQNTGWRVARIKAGIGDRQVHQVTTADCADLLDVETRSEYPKMKSLLVRMFAHAKQKGWFPSQWPNPAAETGTRTGKEKDRRRMTVEQYTAIYQRAPAWLQLAMSIALYTLLRRQDLVRLRLDDVDPSYFLRDSVLHVVPQKSHTNRRKAGPSRLRWDLRQHPELARLIQEARIASMAMGRCPFVVATLPERRTKRAREAKEHHCQVLPGFISKALAKARAQAMAETDLFNGYAPEELPGLHEIRALGSWLLEQADADRKAVAELMAHTDEKMTAAYQSGHAETWTDIALQGAVMGRG